MDRATGFASEHRLGAGVILFGILCGSLARKVYPSAQKHAEARADQSRQRTDPLRCRRGGAEVDSGGGFRVYSRAF